MNVRRLFIYLEHSIDKSTQWAVFEPNNERLWRNIRQTVEDFLLVTWRTGALMGTKPEEAFFVRCDRTTMTPERPRQRPADLPDRCRPDLPGRVRDLPDRPVDRRRAAKLTEILIGGSHGTARPNPYGAFNFTREARATTGGEDQIAGGFSDVSGLGNEVKYSEYRNGNDAENHVRKIANINTHRRRHAQARRHR